MASTLLRPWIDLAIRLELCLCYFLYFLLRPWIDLAEVVLPPALIFKVLDLDLVIRSRYVHGVSFFSFESTLLQSFLPPALISLVIRLELCLLYFLLRP